MITNAFRMRRSEYVLGRPRGRLAGAGGQGRWSMSSTRLTRRLIWRSISVPPQCGCVVTEILRGQLCCDDAWHGCFIYDHVSFRSYAGESGRRASRTLRGVTGVRLSVTDSSLWARSRDKPGLEPVSAQTALYG